MSQIVKPVMLDETGQLTNTKLDGLNASVSGGLAGVSGTVSSGDAAKAAKLLQIAEAIESVHSVNGMTGDVIVDSTNIVLNKLDPESATIQEILANEQAAVTSAVNEMTSAVTDSISRLEEAEIPVSFEVEEIEDEDGDYLLTISMESLEGGS